MEDLKFPEDWLYSAALLDVLARMITPYPLVPVRTHCHAID
jgi:hypothetical protein